MKYITLFLGALASVATAHSDPRDVHAGIPKMLGGRKFLAELRAKNALPAPVQIEERALVVEDHLEGDLEERQINPDGECGPGIGYCPSTQCCSLEGWCGNGIDYCAAPDCQFLYGPFCDANQIPAGNSTEGIARPAIGNIPYGGAGIYDCLVPGDIAFTFDDGPYNYTSDLLDKLLVYNAKATFMITGNNLGKGPIDSTPQWSALIKRMIAEGHQIASHTWSHQNLTSLDLTYFKRQIIYNEMAFNNILGYFPTYMRPPYSECNDTCESILGNLGYHITYFDLDTEGYLNDSPTLIQNSKNIWDAAINPSNNNTDNFLEIEHDIHYQTVYNLTDYILASMYSHGYKSVTVGQCLGDPAVNWYRSGNASAPVPPATQQISIDGTCSATVTCVGSGFGNCCSSAGWCGSTSAYCGAGCQPIAGTCGSSSSSSSSTAAKSTSKTVKSSSTTSSKVSSTSSASQAISTDGTCGTTITCVGSTFGSCCSVNGWCGSTSAYCGTGCNPVGGTCGSSSSSSSSSSSKVTTSSTKSTSSSKTSSKTSSTSTASQAISTDGTCGTTITCIGSTFGSCCSVNGWCGSTSAYCGSGCNPVGGTCGSSSSSSSSSSSKAITSSTKSTSSSKTSSKTSSTSSASQAISTDGTCGTTITCIGSTFGSCCSVNGWCGSTSAYCGTGCNPVGGTCGSSSSSSSTTKSSSSSTKSTTTSKTSTSTSTKTSSSSTPSSTLVVSPDGTCGNLTLNYTCLSSSYGNCCSEYGWCGSTSAYCLTSNGCQSEFGTCS